MLECQTIMSHGTSTIKEESEDLFTEILNQQHGLTLSTSTPSVASFNLDEQFLQQHLQQPQLIQQQQLLQQHLNSHHQQQQQLAQQQMQQQQQLQQAQQLQAQQLQQHVTDEQFLQLVSQNVQFQQQQPQQHGSQPGTPSGGSPYQHSDIDQDYSGDEGRRSRGSTDRSPMETGKARASPGKCKVCGEDATGMYFGALVCVPCKTFFLRYSGGDAMAFICKAQKNCEMTVTSRTQCKYCRFQKCVSVGMLRRFRDPEVQPGVGQHLCAVCADIANGIHFGAMTCEGCKKFFRRGLTENRAYSCKGIKKCLINPQTRNLCRYCRWQNCLGVGMSREAIQMGRPSKIPARTVYCSKQKARFGKSSKCTKNNPGNGPGWTLQGSFQKNNQDTSMDTGVPQGNQQAGMVGFDPRASGQRINSGESFHMSAPISGSFSPSGSIAATDSISSASTDSVRSFNPTSPPDMSGSHGRSWAPSDPTAEGSMAGLYTAGGANFGSPFKAQETQHLVASHDQFLNAGNTTGNLIRSARFVPTTTAGGFTLPTSAADAAHGASSSDYLLVQPHPSAESESQTLPIISTQAYHALETDEAIHMLNHWMQNSSSAQATFDMLLPRVQARQFQNNGVEFNLNADLNSLQPTVNTSTTGDIFRIANHDPDLLKDLLNPAETLQTHGGRSYLDLSQVNDFESLSAVDIQQHLDQQPTSQHNPQSILSEVLASPTGVIGVGSGFSGQHRGNSMNPPSQQTSVGSARSFVMTSQPWTSAATTLSGQQTSEGLSSQHPDTMASSIFSTSFQLSPEDLAKDAALLLGDASRGLDKSTVYDPEPKVDPEESFIIDGHISLEDQVHQSWIYWRNLPRPENVMVKTTHFEVVSKLLASYHKFVQLGTKINRRLTGDFAQWIKNRNVDDCLEHLPVWIQNEVVRVFTLASITYLKGLPGFMNFHDVDQATLIRLGQSQSRILVAALHWYDPDERNFQNFLSWREFKFGPRDPFKRMLLDYAEKINNLVLDAVEAALINVLAILATDFPGLKRPDLIEASQKRVLLTFEAYLTAKYGSQNNRLEIICSYIPEVRRLGLIHYKMTLTPSLGVARRTSRSEPRSDQEDIKE